MTQPLHRSLLLNPAPPPLFPSPFFPILHLPPELTIHIASFLTPRDNFALLLTSHAFDHILAVFTTCYTRVQVFWDAGDVEHFTPLEYFCSRGVERVVQRMLQNGVNPNKTVPTGDVADTDLLLHELDAMRSYLPRSQVEQLDTLLSSLNAPHDPAHASARTNRISDLIRKFDLDPPHHISPLIHAVWNPSPKIVDLLLQYGADPNERETSQQFIFDNYSTDNTPLHFAVGEPPEPLGGYYTPENDTPEIADDRRVMLEQIVQLLIDAGADVNARNVFLHSPLHVACATTDGNPVFVRALIAAGADMNLKAHLLDFEDERVKPIHYAVNAGHADIVQVLLDAGAGIEFRTRSRLRPLDLAVLHRRSDLVKMLVAAGADLRDLVGGGTSLLDPFAFMTETTTPKDLKIWFRARLVRANRDTLAEWLAVGMGTNLPPEIMGEMIDFCRQNRVQI